MQEQGRQRLLPAFLRGEAAPAAGLWRWRGGACWRAGAPGVCARRGRPQGVHQSSLTPYCSRSARQTVGRGPRKRRRRRLPTSVGNRPPPRRGRQPTTKPLSACPTRRSAAPADGLGPCVLWASARRGAGPVLVRTPGGGMRAARGRGLLAPRRRGRAGFWARPDAVPARRGGRSRQSKASTRSCRRGRARRARLRRYRRALSCAHSADRHGARPPKAGLPARRARRTSHGQGLWRCGASGEYRDYYGQAPA